HHALARLVADARFRRERAAVVEDPHLVAVADAARGGIRRVHVKARLPRLGERERQVRERGIQEVPVGRRDDGEGIFPREVRARLRGLARRDERWQGIEPHLLRRLAVELALPRGRMEIPFGEGREALGNGEALEALVLERLPAYAARVRTRERERRAGQNLVAVVEAIVGE